MHVETEPEATMPKKLTKAEAAAQERFMARIEVRTAARAKVVSATISALRPDLEIAYICGDLPHWFSLLLGKCEVGAMSEVNDDIHYHNVLFRSLEDEEARDIVYNKAYIAAFADMFPKLLSKALAKYEAEKDQPHRVRSERSEALRAKVMSTALRTLRPDLEIADICGDLPFWVRRLLARCGAQATSAIVTARLHKARRSAESEEDWALVFDEAFAETFPKLLARALARPIRESAVVESD
jgi:hypothetical protein